jgi:hypothetical protein
MAIKSSSSSLIPFAVPRNFLTKKSNQFFVAIAIQVFEMVTLFLPFVTFYSKVYSKNKASSEKISWDSDISPDNSVPEHDSVS